MARGIGGIDLGRARGSMMAGEDRLRGVRRLGGWGVGTGRGRRRARGGRGFGSIGRGMLGGCYDMGTGIGVLWIGLDERGMMFGVGINLRGFWERRGGLKGDARWIEVFRGGVDEDSDPPSGVLRG
ncbi:hypothetical protein KVT40_001170 [Elsinoe batatas]|uniref:Uncharacterized protein n=1 Tax=Elsinoe batatas TaxID=2601811 RepID=A0A8K0LB14_9PEZI|nr:hypothetical protein KVT40_001170 [Elsinoe batatas]